MDWSNDYKLTYDVPSYFFRYDGYKKGLNNSHIMKSIFGRKSHEEILEDINKWFHRCVGAYNEINLLPSSNG